jgi:hypothetical protein
MADLSMDADATRLLFASYCQLSRILSYSAMGLEHVPAPERMRNWVNSVKEQLYSGLAILRDLMPIWIPYAELVARESLPVRPAGVMAPDWMHVRAAVLMCRLPHS